MRTLVISDLHIGSRIARDVIRRPAVLERLLGAVADADRVVLLGDTVEMLEGRPHGAMRDAQPFFRALGAAMGKGGDIILLPGNHDHALVRPWLRERAAAGRPLGTAERVPIRSSPHLKEIANWLRPARVEVRYPGVDLGDGVWAHHGHYLDRHLVRPTTSAQHSTPEQYEQTFSAKAIQITSGVAAMLPDAVGDTIDRGMKFVMKGAIFARPVVAAFPRAGLLAPLSAGALGYQFRRSGLPAMTTVANHLGVDATDIIFGHLHRAGPRSADDGAEWERSGRRLWNTGCWVYEPLLLAGASPANPYWPGGALWVDGGQITSVGLLDDVDPRDLWGSPRSPKVATRA